MSFCFFFQSFSLHRIFLFYVDNVNQLRSLNRGHKQFYSSFIEAYNISIIFLSSGTYNTLKRMVLLFVSYFFWSFTCDKKLVSFQLYWFINNLILNILYQSFTKNLWFDTTVTAYQKLLSSSLFFGFIVTF